MENKKVAYFGGYYAAEHSMWHSFRDAGVDIRFPYFSANPEVITVNRIIAPPNEYRQSGRVSRR